MKSRPALRDVVRSVVTPKLKEWAALVAWGLLALVSLTLVTLPGDQTSAGIDWLIRSLEPGR